MSKISELRAPTVTVGITPRDRGGHTLNGKERLLITVDAATGEEVSRHIDDGREMPKKSDWLAIYQSFAAEIARGQPSLSPLENRALWLVVSVAGFGNKAVVNVSATARDWGVAREGLSRALSSLVDSRIIERAKCGAYRLNPNFCWKGDHEVLSQHRAAWARKAEKRSAA